MYTTDIADNKIMKTKSFIVFYSCPTNVSISGTFNMERSMRRNSVSCHPISELEEPFCHLGRLQRTRSAFSSHHESSSLFGHAKSRNMKSSNRHLHAKMLFHTSLLHCCSSFWRLFHIFVSIRRFFGMRNQDAWSLLAFICKANAIVSFNHYRTLAQQIYQHWNSVESGAQRRKKETESGFRTSLQFKQQSQRW